MNPHPAVQFGWVGGQLCLDFANTISEHNPPVSEKLLSFAHLVAWGEQAGVIGNLDARTLLERNAEAPAEGEKTVAIGIELRETVFRLFNGLAHGQEPEPADLQRFNEILALWPVTIQVASGSGGDLRCVHRTGGRPDACLLAPVARSAADLLANTELSARVRQCSAPDCQWLFLDLSKNRSRRWCSMDDCGDRAKAQRYYHRHKAKPVVKS